MGGAAAPIADAALERFGELVAAAAAPIDDVRGSAAYRRHALGVLARRTLAWAVGGAAMRLTLTVNGEPREADGVWEGESLLNALRERLGLPGSKNACEQGECGSCSVYLDGELVCSCLVLAGQAEGREVVTVEGLAAGDELHAVQQAFVEAGAVQCGFCTPGLIVASHDLLARNATPTDAEIREALAGNLCRCTGYEKILDAVRLAAGGGDEDSSSRAARSPRWTPPAPSIATGTSSIEGDRIVAVGAGPAPEGDARRAIDGRGCLATPGLVNCHHHLYQWATRGLAQQATLFEWLVELYPVWAHIDDEVERRGRARRAGRARALGLHDLDRPPLRLPGRRRRPARGRDRGGARARPALPPVPRLDGPRAAPTAGCRPTRSSRTATRSSPPARRRSTASTTRRRARWCASRSRRARRSRSRAS